MIECVMNVSEGRDESLVQRIAANEPSILDIHSDADHNRSVFTMIGIECPRAVARRAVESLDLSGHEGVHPRLGVVDVVPFVALASSTVDDARRARDDFARWAAEELAVPVFLYGLERTLPDVRRSAWHTLEPDIGPSRPHPTAGAMCVGTRPVLIAYNVFLADNDLVLARDIAHRIRRPGLRTLAFVVDGTAQVSMNIVNADGISISDVYDAVADEAKALGTRALRAELVGLLLERHLRMNDQSRWAELDLGPDKTIESRLR